MEESITETGPCFIINKELSVLLFYRPFCSTFDAAEVLEKHTQLKPITVTEFLVCE